MESTPFKEHQLPTDKDLRYLDNADHIAYIVSNQEFVVRKGYELTKEMGHGAYGLVCASKSNNGPAAIKKLANVFSRTLLAKRALREMKLLKHFRGHKNITHLFFADVVDIQNFEDIYLYEELMEADLHSIIKSRQPLTDAHYQSFIYQTLVGLKYIHSANVIHRDLKPGNLLVNHNCSLKICDFGLARGIEFVQSENPASGLMTEYVATRWYRAPEILLGCKDYTAAIDVWSVGCILAELLGGVPFFKGRDYVDQLDKIIAKLGKPLNLASFSSRAQQYVESLPNHAGQSFESVFPKANPFALDLLRKLLAFDPRKRISVEDALKHPYLAQWHNPKEELVCPEKFNFEFEKLNTVAEMREHMKKDIESLYFG